MVTPRRQPSSPDPPGGIGATIAQTPASIRGTKPPANSATAVRIINFLIVGLFPLLPIHSALYYFGNDFAEERLVLDGTTSGGVTINDCLIHAAVKRLPFGGTGPSGMGAYHGKTGFLTFSHARSVYRQSRSPQAEHFIRPPFGSQTRAFLSTAFTME
jgi:hypothetical protein